MAKGKRKITHIGIIGRRWRDKTYGNTYNTAEIFVNGKKVAKLPRGYGYGDHYVTRAEEWLVEHGYVTLEKYSSGGHKPLWQLAKDEGFGLDREAIDVPRKSDL